MRQYVRCTLPSCGYAWNHQGAHFCEKCGKAVFSHVTPPWLRGQQSPDKGKGWPKKGKGDGKHDMVDWGKNNQNSGKSKGKEGKGGGKAQEKGKDNFAQRSNAAYWSRRAEERASRTRTAAPDAAGLVESIAAIPGMHGVDLSVLREKAAAIGVQEKAEAVAKPHLTKPELDALQVLKDSSFFAGNPALASLSGKAEKAVGNTGAKELPLHELEKRITHKESTAAKAKLHVEACQLGVAEAGRKLEQAVAEAASRSKEYADLVAARDIRVGEDRTAAFFQSLVGGGAQVASILPAISGDEGLRREMEQLQLRAQDLVKRAAEKVVVVAPPVPSAPQADTSMDVSVPTFDDAELDELFNVDLAEGAEPEAKRARRRKLLEVAFKRKQAVPETGGSRRERSRSPTPKATGDPAAAASAAQPS